MSKTQIRIACAIIVFGCSPLLIRAQDKYVYWVKIAECRSAPACLRSQTGFRVRGIKGIVTALHGVADANDIRVIGAPGAVSFDGPLKISKVDIKHDVALLTSAATDAEQDDGLEVATKIDWENVTKLRFIGHPLATASSNPRDRNLGIPRLKVLRKSLPGPLIEKFLKRRSPDPDESVVNVDGTLLPGDSGAPGLDANGRIVAIGNGGLQGGFSQICWAIPWQIVALEDAASNQRLVQVRQLDPVALFSFDDESELPEIYRVRITVLNPQQVPVDDARVICSVGGEALKATGGYQFEIPRAKRPSDGKVTFYASKESAFQTGMTDLSLARDPNPAVTIKLGTDDSAFVRGVVVDEDSNGLEGARVSVAGFENEAVITGKGGGFVLPAHKAVGQIVLLRVERNGKSVSQTHPAGDELAIIQIERK